MCAIQTFERVTYTGQERRFLFELLLKLIRKYLSTYKNMKTKNEVFIICKKNTWKLLIFSDFFFLVVKAFSFLPVYWKQKEKEDFNLKPCDCSIFSFLGKKKVRLLLPLVALVIKTTFTAKKPQFGYVSFHECFKIVRQSVFNSHFFNSSNVKILELLQVGCSVRQLFEMPH